MGDQDIISEKELKDLEKELDEKEESRLVKAIKRIFIIFISLLLLILILTYFVPGYPINDIIAGMIESSRIDENFAAALNNGNRVIFEPAVYNELKDIYYKNQRTEFKVCLKGYKINDDYRINELYIPKTYFQSFANVVSQECSSDTLIPLHKHPDKRCIFSVQDINSYNAFKRINNESIIGLMCGKDRFGFYGD